MFKYDEKRDVTRMRVDCEINYKPADSSHTNVGRCKTVSAAGISFIAGQHCDIGLALAVNIYQNASIPALTAFIEVVRCVRRENGHYEIAGVIRSIKGN